MTSDSTSVFDFFHQRQQRGVHHAQLRAEGFITRVVGMTLEARGISVPLGSRCQIERGPNDFIEVETVGFDGSKTYLMPLHPVDSLRPGTRVVPLNVDARVPVGAALLGRVLNGIGQPLDGKGPLVDAEYADFHPHSINPLQREPISQPLDVGVRSINATLAIGCGQRIGLFAGSGVGKSVLLGMMTRFTTADVVVVALVGERGREVREFVENNLGAQGMSKAIVVAAPADDTPVMRLRAGMYASRICEHFRDAGLKVLLLFDSLTRYAQAQREIALAAGEPPATRGYPPSVFARLPQLVERAGNGTGNGGSVTGFYTVLTEGDDMGDPVADSARAILDGHIVLSRSLAAEGVYPAVDIQNSISRSMNQIVSEEQMALSNQLKQLIARYADSKDLISVGAYTEGIDPLTDLSIARQPAIRAFLNQPLHLPVTYAESVDELSGLVETAPQQNETAVVPDEAGLPVTEPVSASETQFAQTQAEPVQSREAV